jgi:hypothetical protein
MMRALLVFTLVAACEKTSSLDDQPAPPEVDVALVGALTAPPPAKSIPTTVEIPVKPPEPIAPIPLEVVDAGVPGPTSRITIADPQPFDESTLTPDLVLRKIQTAYMAGLKRCYKNYLLRDPAARGKIVLDITVDATGRTVNSRANGFARDVDDCITGNMSSWRFPIPKDRDGEPTEASFAITLRFVPD